MAKKKKKPVAQIKLQIPAGSANPAPPVGPALGQHGVNIMQFCKAFNDATKNREGLILPVIISVYEDRSFDFVIKSPPASVLLKRAANLAKASSQAGKEIIAQVTRKQVIEIAKQKMADLNTSDLEKAIKIIEGTARSCGIKVVEDGTQ
ncbi:MAG: 50S ribosomal protein L11 [Candidatus Omnitrophica bacterium 4484_70.2]|nr:MAG: 50S ribosomal protein L11 [Candidatus Omnitrophica bacterium 4484_70.2]